MRGTERISQIQAFALNFIELAIGVLLLIHHPGGEFVLYVLTLILSFMISLRALFFIRSGRFRTYFIAGASCVSFTDTLIRTPGLDLFDLSNFVIPGTYLAFLNSEYERGDSAVICRTLYAAGVHEALDSHEKAADSVNPQLSGF